MIINREEYRDKTLGCWMGKNVGGTLGAPFEWHRQINNVSFYTQDLGGEPLPNDDLDIQLLWLVALEERGVELDAHTLAEYWMLCVTPHWAEYGNAKANMRVGLPPPLSGTMNNPYKNSCGAFIRSEIWACIAPGCPQIAARYAYYDSIIDHGNGEGTYAEVFCAALESAAFAISDVQTLIKIGLSYIPEDCGVAQAVRRVVQLHASGTSWRDARDEVLRHHRGQAGKGCVCVIFNQEDIDKGFSDGVPGYDVPSNIGMMILALLYGEGDFEKTVCMAVNCGEDTDCTGATVGALWGLIYGYKAIPKRWIEPIGEKIKTACLNNGELGGFGHLIPADIHNLTDRVERIAGLVLGRYTHGASRISVESTQSLHPAQLEAGAFRELLFEDINGPTYRQGPLEVCVDYGENGASFGLDTPKTLTVRIRNVFRKYPIRTTLRWYMPDGCEVGPMASRSVFVGYLGPLYHAEEAFTITVPSEAANWFPNGRVMGVLQIEVEGWATILHAPIVLLMDH